MTILQAIILGIVEGVTEFLPVSSTGHLILTSKLLGVADSNFLKSFEIAIQFGAILSVVVLYFKKILLSGELWKKVLTAFLPTAVIGFLLYKVLKTYLLSNSLLVVWSLAIGGVALIIFEWWNAKKTQFRGSDYRTENIDYKKSFLVGLVQSLAIIPGVSRSGATIIGGLLMGINRQAIVEFSFLLAVPTMAAATGYDLYKSAGSFTFGEFHILAIGFLVSFFVAWASIKWLLYFIKNHTFIWFGVYRIVIALLFYFLVIKW
ncbi:MAG: undecaprenyl-diphosphatase UppP [Candidatus Staskawiczbacteria bacterium RIFCSPHIGHO2_02_FULL_43_16]|uniref:Undecaprenyl-diphosphatase n=1 Tax=Candidatus Staskawiczbacteria bacterium RIFCSPHIGHO2_01_FULL_41_41 TaxID=1802203 RepID=A0A1G2HT07_9BACT|nr:MAG: undecaprenyl-diphosphatase UppP [Candidatus Staskawiczbacteria bacterium RIFCSPHIGHO2_01_FULL_41_41]OGZ68216.1 MAG: undecaprenyl-diphosphatase UppP [Candidatus Staskawiczbacteria bacterium RIFCSPHIGHO2_02_FULL_43_16]OGZ75005.1 MAG: undecaprenyl-diphosphatase UppP [Candidatus Staskawiczbacteria bacterium RIFCSPLOWO2_01_FULL_43_17b]